MSYLPKGIGEIYTYNFDLKLKATLLTFGGNDGIISHCKLSGSKSALKIIYVKDCKHIMMYDVNSKVSKLVGKTSDAIVALHI